MDERLITMRPLIGNKFELSIHILRGDIQRFVSLDSSRFKTRQYVGSLPKYKEISKEWALGIGDCTRMGVGRFGKKQPRPLC